MKLTEEQAQVVIKHISKANNGESIICPVCKNESWTINNVVTEMREFQNGDLILGGNSAIVPFVTLSCSNCGNTLFFNAITTGAILPQVEPSISK